jgi:O-antigen biosynthesis protein WbqP
MNRGVELGISCVCIVFLCLPMLFLCALIYVSMGPPIFFWSKRIGQNKNVFLMPKFRTMRRGSPVVSTSGLKDPNIWITPLGSFLRRSSLDELPQLWSVLKGDMSLIGPRPALFNQFKLVEMREEFGVNVLKPGITGIAQITGRDDLSDYQKVEMDHLYLKNRSIFLDLKILALTIVKVVGRDSVSH